jgi:hypothetical protein
LGVQFLFGTFTHLLLVSIWNEYLWFSSGHIDKAPLTNISVLNWTIFFIELIIALSLITKGLKKDKSNE